MANAKRSSDIGKLTIEDKPGTLSRPVCRSDMDARGSPRVAFLRLRRRSMLRGLILLTAIIFGFATQDAYDQPTRGEQPAVTAIDIALEPDATMLQRASALNARLRGAFAKGYALDATHRPHVTLLQRYVRTADLPKIYAAVRKMKTEYDMAAWKFEAFKIDHAVWSGLALTVILAKPPQQVLDAQQQLIEAIAPYTVQTGT